MLFLTAMTRPAFIPPGSKVKASTPKAQVKEGQKSQSQPPKDAKKVDSPMLEAQQSSEPHGSTSAVLLGEAGGKSAMFLPLN